MKVLVVDIGGTSVKLLATGHRKARKFLSGPSMTPALMVVGVRNATRDWQYDVVSIGYPGPVVNGLPMKEPHNLARGWVGFDFRTAFHCPVKVINDAAMQAIGSYRTGKLLFLGLGTGLGSALVFDGMVQPLELAHLPYKEATFEDYVGIRGLNASGLHQWRKDVADVAARLRAALQADEVVLGGGNVHKLKTLPDGCRAGDNVDAFRGGFRLWNASAYGRKKEHQRGKADRTYRKKARQTAGMESAGGAQQRNPRHPSAATLRG
jgi:polyphosphate glucokinase